MELVTEIQEQNEMLIKEAKQQPGVREIIEAYDALVSIYEPAAVFSTIYIPNSVKSVSNSTNCPL